VKSLEQQAVLALHSLRQGYLQTRTARINAIRGHLREFGCVIPVGAQHVPPRVAAALETEQVPALVRGALHTVLEEIRALEIQAETVRTELARLAAQMPDAQLLLTIPGVGVLTATALVASWATSTASARDGTSPPTSGSPRANTRAARSAGWARSPSAATATSACSCHLSPDSSPAVFGIGDRGFSPDRGPPLAALAAFHWTRYSCRRL
jgi:transposase